MEVQDLARNSFDQTAPSRFRDFSVAESAVLELIPQVTEYLHLQERSGQRARDLEAWTSGRRQNIQAHKALMQACAYIYRVERGGEKFLRRAIELDSMFITPRVWLISGLVTDGKREEATHHYQFLRGIEWSADGLEHAMIEWSGSYIDGNVDDQIRHLRTALEYAPGNNILLYTLARLLFIEGNWEGTIAAIEPATEMRWQFSPAYWFLAAARMRLGRIDEAIDALEGSMDIAQKVYHGNYGLLTALCIMNGDSSKASANRKKFIRTFRPTGDSLWLANAELGSIFADAGLSVEAVREYRTACEFSPAVPEYRDSLGCILYRSGNRDAAAAEFEKLIHLNPRAVRGYYYLGMIREDEQRIEDATVFYKQFLAIDSTGTQADDIRRRLSAIDR